MKLSASVCVNTELGQNFEGTAPEETVYVYRNHLPMKSLTLKSMAGGSSQVYCIFVGLTISYMFIIWRGTQVQVSSSIDIVAMHAMLHLFANAVATRLAIAKEDLILIKSKIIIILRQMALTSSNFRCVKLRHWIVGKSKLYLVSKSK